MRNNYSILLAAAAATLLSTLLTASGTPSSSNFQLYQQGLLSGNPNRSESPSSTAYSLQETSLGGISGDEAGSTTYDFYPGFSEPEPEPLAPPVVAITIEGDWLTLTWPLVPGASYYRVYSGADPYGQFTVDNSGTFVGESWTTEVTEVRKFYYVTAE